MHRMLVFNSNTNVQLSVIQTRRYRLSKFGQNEKDFDRDSFDDMGCTWNAGHMICMISLTSRGEPWMSEKRAKWS